MDKEINKKIAMEVVKFLKKHKLNTDTSIYFNNMAYRFNSSGEMTILRNIKGSHYFDYANDKTVSISFEGGLYNVFNEPSERHDELQEELLAIFKKYGFYYERGDAWNIALYPN